MPFPFPSLLILTAQWTLLLALSWCVHLSVRHRHPRWRLMLWRSVLVLSLILPLVGLVRLPRWTLPVPVLPPTAPVEPRATVTRPTEEPAVFLAAPNVRPFPTPAAFNAATASPAEPPVRIVWWHLVLTAWLAGCVFEAIRLLRLQFRLRRVTYQTQAASVEVQLRAREIRGELRIRRDVGVRVTDSVSSPFLCGVIKPTIVLPRELIETLPPAEIDALLSHELAHQCRHDLAWGIAWRWMKAVCWFHPLVWNVPEAHGLACEEEADRIAAGRTYTGENYASLLARLALRVLHLKETRSPIALHATSHLPLRLIRLGRERVTAWRLRHSVTAGAIATGLLVLTAGWQFAQVDKTTPEGEAASVPMATVIVTVLDEQNQPIEGATITPDGLRPGNRYGMGSGHYFWREEKYGPTTEVTTDSHGQAAVEYPVAVVPEEKLMTAEISFKVRHPAFASVRPTSFPVDDRKKPIVLSRGTSIRVTGHHGPARTQVSEIVPHLMGGLTGATSAEDWHKDETGALTSPLLPDGKYYLHVAGRLPSGDMVYSEGVAFFTEQRDVQDFALELKPGIRVEGRLNPSLARPITNGWVQLSVHDDEADTREERIRRIVPSNSGNTGFWWSYRPIAADGTFVFESVPSGELKVIAYGEGFISSNGPVEPDPPSRGVVPLEPPRRTTRAVPQSFPANRPVTQIEVATEASATLTIIAKAGGKPLRDAKVHVSPNMIKMPTGSRLFGGTGISSEAAFRPITPLPKLEFVTSTDANGAAEMRNVPAFTYALGIDHPGFELPLKRRNDQTLRDSPRREIEMNLSPGRSERIEVELQPKGREFIGSAQ